MAVKHYYFRHYYFLSCNNKLAEESEIQKSGVLGKHLKTAFEKPVRLFHVHIFAFAVWIYKHVPEVFGG